MMVWSITYSQMSWSTNTSGPSVQLLSHVQLFATPWTTACQAFQAITNSWNLLKLMLLSQWCHPPSHPLLTPSPSTFNLSSIRIFSNDSILCIRWLGSGVSSSTSVPPMNIQEWFPFRRTGWISLQSKGLSRVFSNTTVQKHQFFGAQLSL